MILPKLSSHFCTHIDLPASKSLSNRWLMLRACTASETVLHNLSDATDTVLMQNLLDKISQTKPSENPVEIDCKNAGTALRFLTAYLSATPGKWLITGDERLSVRPIADLIDALNSLGAEISYVNKQEQLPLLIVGKPEFSHSSVTLNMEKSSQFASALMLIISKFPNGLTIDFDGEIISKPYLEMTAKILEQCGVQVNRTEKNIVLNNTTEGCFDKLSNQPPQMPTEVFIEADWTSASYFYALVALSENGVLEIDNLHENSLQGDSILARWFERFGVETIFSSSKITIKKVSKPSITELDLDFSDYPDLAQTMAVLCVALNIPARLTGLSTLRDKETDRLQALSNELNKIGAKNSIEKNTLILYKNDTLNFSQPIETYGDHRMAMAFAIFSERYDCVEITSPEIVNKSFPNFWEQHNKLKLTH